jgi:CHAT domain-containing protein
MAIRCLAVILTLWMVSVCHPRAIRPGSAGSSWWGSRTTLELYKEIYKAVPRLLAARDFLALEALYGGACDQAVRLRDPFAEMRFRMGIGGARLARYEYRGALQAYLAAKGVAAAHGYREDLGAIDFNLANLYEQVWDVDSAMQSAEEGGRAIAGLPGTYYHSELCLRTGQLRAEHGRPATEFFAEAIDAARAKGDIGLEAQSWDATGDEHLRLGRTAAAEAAYVEAFRLRTLHRPVDLGLSYARLGAIRLEEGRLEEADRFTHRAIQGIGGGENGRAAFPPYRLRHQLGRIRLAAGDTPEALNQFEEAVRLALEWNAGGLQSTAALNGANFELERSIVDAFVKTAADHSLKTGDPLWAEKAFLVLERNRAASLREGIAVARGWQDRVTPEFWRTLALLRAEEMRLLRASKVSSETSRSLQLRLAEIEAGMGIDAPATGTANKNEIFPRVVSLKDFQGGLSRSEVVLSFHLGAGVSYRWAVTNKSIFLSKIGGGKQISAAVRRLRQAIRGTEPEAAAVGASLYSELFGSLKLEETEKSDWLLSLEGELFDLPFAALVIERKGGQPVYLVMGHTVQVVPGALSLNSPAWEGVWTPSPCTRPTGGWANRRRIGWFLGVGDPVYNQADPRWIGRPPAFSEGLPPMPRLIGSAPEVTGSARSWRAESGGAAVLLTGIEATRDGFLKTLAEHPPAVVHLATHVLPAPGRLEQAFIGFSADGRGSPDVLTTADVAMLRVPGALVVMSGCGSGTGAALPGSGLLGLTRAWQVAGAAATVATLWPTSDASSDFFPRFYHHLAHSGPAEALRRAQVEMAGSATWQAAPAFWAAYQITGGGR